MDTVIGLGKAGCNIVDKFAEFPQYSTYKIDTGLKKTKHTYPLKEYEKLEDYEEKIALNEVVLQGGERRSSLCLGGIRKSNFCHIINFKKLKKVFNKRFIY